MTPPRLCLMAFSYPLASGTHAFPCMLLALHPQYTPLSVQFLISRHVSSPLFVAFAHYMSRVANLLTCDTQAGRAVGDCVPYHSGTLPEAHLPTPRAPAF